MNEQAPDPITLTHARLRARQGDRRGAERILRAWLTRHPGDPDANALLEHVRRTGATAARSEAAEPAAVREPARPADLARRFRRELAPSTDPRVGRLRRWLAAILRV